MQRNSQGRSRLKRWSQQLLAGLGLLGLAVMAHAQGAGYWHTSGNQILDSNNQPVRIAGVNWYGFETIDFVPHGIYSEDYKSILDSMKSNGYNVIRLPFSNQVVESNPVPTNIQYAGGKNSDLRGLTALQIMDKIIAYAGSIGLRVILDNHRSDAGNSAQDSGLWYTSAYPESAWINDWVTLASRYLNNTTVIGMDLRNEPHSASCWGCGDLSRDWRLAAQRAGNAVLTVNSQLLIFVEGNDCFNGDCYWWGGNLLGVAQFPVTLNVPNRLVYSAHDYGPVEFQQRWFTNATTPASLNAIFNKYWGYIAANNIAPVWVGEFGTPNTNIEALNTASGSQGQWFSSLVNYLKANPNLSWTYWAYNGEDRYGILNPDYGPTPANATKQQMLASIQFPLGAGTAPTPTPNPQPPPPVAVPSISALAPTSGLPGAAVTISGANFGATQGSSTVTFGGSTAMVTAWSNTSLSVRVPQLTAGAVNVVVRTAAGTSNAAMFTVTAAPPPPPPTGGGFSCRIGYAITSQWATGFQTAITVTNTSTAPISSWTLQWTFANGQQITNLWNGVLTQSGAAVVVNSAPYNGAIAAGGSTMFGFVANRNATNAIPVAFTMNGVLCQ
jgi:endoglucanase